MDAVVNWLWQGSAMALVTAVLLRLLDRSRAGARYAVCWTSLAAILLLPFVPHLPAPVPAPLLDAMGAANPLVAIPDRWWTSSLVAVAACTLWSVLHALRLAVALRALRRAKQQCRPLPRHCEARLRHWTEVRGRRRHAQLAVSGDVRAAAVLGGRSPVIALAPALLERLAAEDIDRVVIHEWAHVQRRDDVAHFVQQTARAIAGWHPAVWWIDRQLQIEREVACDEITVAITGSPRAYAASLAKLASLPAPPLGPLPLVGALSAPPLARRVSRMLSPRRVASGAWSRSAAAACIAALAAVAIGVGAIRIVATAVVPSVDALAPRTVDLPLTPAQEPDDAQALAQTPASTPHRLARRAASTPGRLASPLAHERASSVTPSGTTAGRDAVEPDAVSGAEGLPPLQAARRRGTDAVDARWSGHTAAVGREDPRERRLLSDLAPTSIWEAVARTGVAVGEGSRTAGSATAGFFGRAGKRIAGAF